MRIGRISLASRQRETWVMGQYEHPSKSVSQYRNSQYFLADQLRCSEVVEDFRSVKDLVNRGRLFSVRSAFRFQPQSIPIQPD